MILMNVCMVQNHNDLDLHVYYKFRKCLFSVKVSTHILFLESSTADCISHNDYTLYTMAMYYSVIAVGLRCRTAAY